MQSIKPTLGDSLSSALSSHHKVSKWSGATVSSENQGDFLTVLAAQHKTLLQEQNKSSAPSAQLSKKPDVPQVPEPPSSALQNRQQTRNESHQVDIEKKAAFEQPVEQAARRSKDDQSPKPIERTSKNKDESITDQKSTVKTSKASDDTSVVQDKRDQDRLSSKQDYQAAPSLAHKQHRTSSEQEVREEMDQEQITVSDQDRVVEEVDTLEDEALAAQNIADQGQQNVDENLLDALLRTSMSSEIISEHRDSVLQLTTTTMDDDVSKDLNLAQHLLEQQAVEIELPQPAMQTEDLLLVQAERSPDLAIVQEHAESEAFELQPTDMPVEDLLTSALQQELENKTKVEQEEETLVKQHLELSPKLHAEQDVEPEQKKSSDSSAPIAHNQQEHVEQELTSTLLDSEVVRTEQVKGVSASIKDDAVDLDVKGQIQQVPEQVNLTRQYEAKSSEEIIDQEAVTTEEKVIQSETTQQMVMPLLDDVHIELSLEAEHLELASQKKSNTEAVYTLDLQAKPQSKKNIDLFQQQFDITRSTEMPQIMDSDSEIDLMQSVLKKEETQQILQQDKQVTLNQLKSNIPAKLLAQYKQLDQNYDKLQTSEHIVAERVQAESSTPVQSSVYSQEKTAHYMMKLRMQGHAQAQQSPHTQLASRSDMMQALHDKFAPMMRHQIMMMTDRGVTSADLQLDPPELGLIHIRIQMQGEQTQVQFQVNQVQTRDLLEQSLARLRDLLHQQGFSLTDGQVSQQQQDQQQRQPSKRYGHYAGQESEEMEQMGQLRAYHERRLVDYYA
tara:strand:- start:3182 stop:5536 length:2355 start_codon:yes stop_codon:yes gene_type:complete